MARVYQRRIDWLAHLLLHGASTLASYAIPRLAAESTTQPRKSTSTPTVATASTNAATNADALPATTWRGSHG